MSPRKILIFSTAYLPFLGGAEVSVKELTDKLSKDFSFDLITAKLKSNLSAQEQVGAVTVYRIGIGVPIIDKFFLPYFGAWKAWRLNKKNNYICFWGIMASFSTGAAYIVNMVRGFLGRKKVPMVLTLQEGDSEEWLRYRWLGLLDLSWRMALKRTDILTGLSNYLLDRAKRLGYRGRAELVPNGVDFDRFKALDSRAKNQDEVILIHTGRLVEKNGVADIIEALSFLPANVKLRLAGTGALESKLKLKAKNLHLEDRVQFLGYVPNEEMPKHLHEADIFIRPSLSEGQGISFIEAMAAGVPVIATPVGGIPDFLEDRITGLFCAVSDPKSIALRAMEYVKNPALVVEITKNAEDLVRTKYDWGLISNELKTRVFDKV